MSDKPHANAVRSPEGFWLMLESEVPAGWKARWGPAWLWEPMEGTRRSRSDWWIEARP
jgi:hypothetical protein